MFTRMLTGVIVAGALSIPLAGVASAAPPANPGDVSVSVNGTPRKTSTSLSSPSTAETTPRDPTVKGGANVAIARNGSHALAGEGTGNKARASNDAVRSPWTGITTPPRPPTAAKRPPAGGG